MQIITRQEAAKHNASRRHYYLNKFDNKCVKCGSLEKLELDHIIAITEGGDNSEENIQVLCKSCNIKKGGKRYKGDEHHTRKNPKKNTREPYQIRIEPTMLEQLKKLSKENDTSVNHEIRQAIKKRLQENN